MILAACALPVVAAANQPPEIANVKAKQLDGTKLVEITYDAADADGDKLKIRVEVSSDDGTTYSVPASSFSGDFGEGVTPGTGKKIVWNAGTDWDGEYSDKMKVKVFALDGHGFPGMEFGSEIPPGGFLMGQDGGEEGNGPSRHVCIPWSYWLGKYEVTNAQYCDFLNAAYAMGYVTQSEATSVFAASLPASYPKSSDATLCSIGDDYGIRWNVNKFEVVSGREKWPVAVTWYGAMTFCRFYGYDLPTEAEWEMAARGPDRDDENEHCKFPWGNGDPDAGAFLERSSSERLCDVTSNSKTNAYGLFHIMGNAAEWTRSLADSSVEAYPTTESLTNSCNKLYSTASRVVRGTYETDYMPDPIYKRTSAEQTSNGGGEYGFRVVRRYPSQPDSTKRLFLSENFDSWSSVPSIWHPTSGVEVVSNPVDGALATDKVVKFLEEGDVEYKFYLPDSVNAESVVEVTFDGLGGTFQKSAEMTFYSGYDPEYKTHDNSSGVTVSFPTIDNPRNWTWTVKSFAPAFTDQGFQHCFSVESIDVPIYINNLKVYVEEVVTP